MLRVATCSTKIDALIAWQDVQEHATDLAQMGLPVTEVMFEWKRARNACETRAREVLDHFNGHVVE